MTEARHKSQKLGLAILLALAMVLNHLPAQALAEASAGIQTVLDESSEENDIGNSRADVPEDNEAVDGVDVLGHEYSEEMTEAKNSQNVNEANSPADETTATEESSSEVERPVRHLLAARSTYVSDPRVVEDASMAAGQVTTWDCVWLGSYPQTYVDDKDTIDELDSALGWDANGDIFYKGKWYRRLSASDSLYTSEGSNYWDWERASSAHYCYFVWAPIKWRVLEADDSSALVVADIALDDREYNETRSEITWETCTLREWLGSIFLKDALNENQREAVIEQAIINADNTSYQVPGGSDTNDRVFLLSESEVWSTDAAARHGFTTSRDLHDEARYCEMSDYAWAKGAWQSDFENRQGGCYWWLRSPGRTSNRAANVHYDGSASSIGYYVNYDLDHFNFLVRPAMRISLASNQVSYAGTVSSNGAVDEQAAPYSGSSGETQGRVFPSWYNEDLDTFNFVNFWATIPYFYYVRLLIHPGYAYVSWLAGGGENQKGTCYGIAAATASLLNGLPDVKTTFNDRGIGYNESISDILLYAGRIPISSWNIPIKEFIKLNHANQFTPSSILQRAEGGTQEQKALSLLETVQEHTDSGRIDILIRIDGPHPYKHELLAVGYEGRDILIDDPNWKKNIGRLTVNQDGTWQYFDGDQTFTNESSNIYWETFSDYPYRSVFSLVNVYDFLGWETSLSDAQPDDVEPVEPDEVPDDGLYIGIEADSYDMVKEPLFEITPATSTDDNGTGLRAFWLQGSRNLSIANLQGENPYVVVGADNIAVESHVSNGASIDVTIQDNSVNETIQTAKNQEVNLDWHLCDQDSFRTIAVEGKANGETIEAKSDNDVIEIIGLSDATADLKEEDGTVVSSIKLTDEDGQSVSIVIDDNGISSKTPSHDVNDEVPTHDADNKPPTQNSDAVTRSRNISDSTVKLSSEKVSYTGKPIEPTITVSVNGATLSKGKDYTVSFSNNTRVGTATVSIVGIGLYSGKLTRTFQIVKAPSSIKLAMQSVAYTGTSLDYSGKVTKSGSSGKITYRYYSDAKCTKEIKTTDVKVAGTYYVRATLAADTNYESATSAPAAFTIVKGTNPLTVKSKKMAKVKASKLRKKTIKLKASKVLKVTGAKGKVTYKKMSGNKKIKIASKTGKVTIKKGLKKGTYKVKVRVTAAGNANWKKASRTVTFKIKVK